MLRVAWDMTTLPEIKNSVASILDTKVTGDIAVRFVQWDLYRQSSDCEFSAFNPFFPNVPVLYPLKPSENLCEKGTFEKTVLT